jgi:hypothetical protein
MGNMYGYIFAYVLFVCLFVLIFLCFLSTSVWVTRIAKSLHIVILVCNFHYKPCYLLLNYRCPIK